MNNLHIEVRDGLLLDAVVTMPPAGGLLRGGLVTLHPAGDPRRDYYLFRHLARVLPPLGIAVLSYDRRPKINDRDVLLADQADDALRAVSVLRERLSTDVPVGLWGFSQGAWAAALAAQHSDQVRCLIVVALCGVSPAHQMRWAAGQHLRQAGYTAEVLTEVDELRQRYEQYLRDGRDGAEVAAALSAAARRPWFDLSFLPDTPRGPGSWPDLDFDPGPIVGNLTVPVLAFYGTDDPWLPVDRSVREWDDGGRHKPSRDVTVVRLPRTGHEPILPSAVDSRDDEYSARMSRWLTARLASGMR